MCALMDTFTTTNHNDFGWPYPIPLLAVPSQPPKNTGPRLYLQRFDPDDCTCPLQGSENDMRRYKRLMAKEHELCSDIAKVNHEMTRLLSNMIDKSQSEDETMKSIYQIAHENRDTPIANYRSLMAAVDSPVGSPIEPVISELKDGYRDPTRFRYGVTEEPAIQPVEAIDFATVPEMYSAWSAPFTGRSEYMDTISKLGRSNLQNQKQYLEPHPSSRRKWGNQEF